MPEQVTVEFEIPVLQSVPALKSIYRAVLVDGVVYWEVRVVYNETQIVSQKHYNLEYLEVFSGVTSDGEMRVVDFEKTLLDKALEIDNMEEGAEKTARTNKKIESIIIGDV